jgi:hypothetical protein
LYSPQILIQIYYWAEIVLLKRPEFNNRTKANDNKAKDKQNSKKEERIKGDAQNVHHLFRDIVMHAVVSLI